MKIKVLIIFTFLISYNIYAIGTSEIKALKTTLSNADQIEISFGWWENDKCNKSKIEKVIQDRKKIKTFINYISHKKAYITECGYDGTLDFKKNGISLLEEKVLFTIECKRFLFIYKGKEICVFITNDGLKYLNDLYNEFCQQ